MKGFATGLSGYAVVIPLFAKLGLWRYLVLTAAISVGVALGLLAGCVALFAWLNPDNAWGWVRYAIAVGLTAAGGLLFFKHIVLVLASPWMGTVAARVEDHFRKTRGLPPAHHPPLSGGALLRRSLRLNLKLLVSELLWTIPLALLAFVPVLNLAATVVLLLVQSYFAGAGLLDYGMERALDYRQARAYIRGHRGLALGSGAGFVLLLLTGVGFLVAPAWSAAAAAWAFARQSATDEVATAGARPAARSPAGA